MGKVILWIVLVFAILFVLRLVNISKMRRTQNPGSAGKKSSEATAVMVRCAECGVFLPQADARPGPKGPCCGDAQCRQRADANR